MIDSSVITRPGLSNPWSMDGRWLISGEIQRDLKLLRLKWFVALASETFFYSVSEPVFFFSKLIRLLWWASLQSSIEYNSTMFVLLFSFSSVLCLMCNNSGELCPCGNVPFVSITMCNIAWCLSFHSVWNLEFFCTFTFSCSFIELWLAGCSFSA